MIHISHISLLCRFPGRNKSRLNIPCLTQCRPYHDEVYNANFWLDLLPINSDQ